MLEVKLELATISGYTPQQNLEIACLARLDIGARH